MNNQENNVWGQADMMWNGAQAVAAMPPAEDRDDLSFDDSERFEDDSVCSWQSSESLSGGGALNWGGWASLQQQQGRHNLSDDAQQPSCSRSSTTLPAIPAGGKRGRGMPLSLASLSTRACARSLSFQHLEHYYNKWFEAGSDGGVAVAGANRIPDNVFLPIIKCCFPDSEHDIRLYSCLANSNSEEYGRGSRIYEAAAIRNVMQIGYLISAEVWLQSDQAGVAAATTTLLDRATTTYNVSIRVDRCRVVQCECSCASKSAWCAHVVAVCLVRLHRPHTVQYRATVWDSVNELDPMQLKKLVAYLINDLPRQYLPVAQCLLDGLRNADSEMNRTEGAPDPTDGEHDDTAIWCLDRGGLREQIRRTLTKFCVPAPSVHCDVQYLSATQPPIASEFQAQLSPLRTRQPEGLWNLLSIVREMFRRRDENANILLHIVTEECLQNSQVMMWWYTSRLAASGEWQMTAKKSAGAATSAGGGGGGGAAVQNHSNAALSCAELCEEVVQLWRLAALNPANGDVDRMQLAAQLQIYHRAATMIIWKALNPHAMMGTGVQSAACSILCGQLVDSGGARLGPATARFTKTLFPGFHPALEVCQVEWSDFRVEGLPLPRMAARGGAARRVACEMAGVVSEDRLLRRAYAPAPPVWPAEMDYDEGGGPGRKKKKKSSRRRAAASSNPLHLPEFFDGPSLDRAVRRAARQAGRLHQQRLMEGVGGESAESGQESDSNGVGRVADAIPENMQGPHYPEEDVEMVLASTHVGLVGQELRFARCESLWAHGCGRAAACLADSLMRSLLASPPPQLASLQLTQHALKVEGAVAAAVSIEDPKSMQRMTRASLRRSEAAAALCLQPPPDEKLLAASEQAVTMMQRAVLIAQVLQSHSSCRSSVLAFVLFVLRQPRLPMATKALQVRLYVLECELISHLRRMEVGAVELESVRKCAAGLIMETKNRQRLLPAVQLAHFLMDTLAYRQNMFPPTVGGGGGGGGGGGAHGPSPRPSSVACAAGVAAGRRPDDDTLSIRVALDALGHRIPFSEVVFPMLWESVRRQRADLAMSLLSRHRDSGEMIALVLDRLLDPAACKMYKSHCSNAAYLLAREPSLAKHTQRGQRPSWPIDGSLDLSQYLTTPASAAAAVAPSRSVDGASPSASLESGEGGEGGETETMSLNSLTDAMSRATVDSVAGASSDGGDEDSPPGSSTQDVRPAAEAERQTSVDAYVEEDAEASRLTAGSSAGDTSYKHIKRRQLYCTGGGGSPFSSSPSSSSSRTSPSLATCAASEAQAHSMFELAKRLLLEAGGGASTAMFNAGAVAGGAQGGQGSARLRLASFIVGLYALGLNNRVSITWMTRTYSTFVSWVCAQAVEMGSAGALEVVLDTWPELLRPTEAAGLADKASQCRDPSIVAASARLALSVLPRAYQLSNAECIRALQQCKDQGSGMLEQALRAVEQAEDSSTDDSGRVSADVLQRVARYWQELHVEETGGQSAGSGQMWQAMGGGGGGGQMFIPQQHVQYAGGFMMDPSQPPPPPPAMMQQQQPPAPYFHPHMQPPPMYVAPPPQLGGMPMHQQQLQQQPGRPHSVYMQPPPHQHQLYYGGPVDDASAAVGVGGGVVSPSMHHSHSAPNLQPAMGAQLNLLQRRESHQGVAGGGGVEQAQQRMEKLLNAHRIGLLAMERWGAKLAEDNRNPDKYSKNPSFGDDVLWLWGVSLQLGPLYAGTFCDTAARCIHSPFLTFQLAREAANKLHGYQYHVPLPHPHHHSQQQQQQQQQPQSLASRHHGQIRAILMQHSQHPCAAELMDRSVELCYAAIQQKMNHGRMTDGHIDEICQLVSLACDVSNMIPVIGPHVFESFMRHVKHQKCKKEIMQRVNQHLAQLNGRSYAH